MTLLIAGLVLFIGTHSIRIFADGFRTRQIAKLGAGAWKGAYALVSLAGLVMIVYGYGMARADPLLLWLPPVWTRHVAALLTLPAFVLVVAAYVPGTRIKAAVGHPMALGVKIWALAHLIANDTLADVLLFGAFLAWAVAYYATMRRRDRNAGTRYPTGPLTRDLIAVTIGIAAWFAFAVWAHAWLIGVRPFG
jgi:uncharacterized membrane protein